LELWQKVAKALTENELRVLNLSERLNPDGRPTVAEWLIGFRAAVDRFNDPNRGMVRVLKRIIVRTVDFERWCRRANRLPRGPKRGTTGFRAADRKLFSQMSRLIKKDQARSRYGAALMLVDQGRVAGHGTRESKAKRLSAAYRLEESGAPLKLSETIGNDRGGRM
jgi:hypothetical protein